MALTFVASGAWVSGTTSITPVIPAHAVGDLLVLTLVSKYEDAALGTITGELANWVDQGGLSNATRTTGNDNGGMRIRLFTRIASTTTTPGPPLAPLPNNMSAAHVTVYRVASGFTYDILTGLSADNTAGTPLLVASPLLPLAGDLVHADMALNGDVVTWGASTISGTGATFGSMLSNVADTSTASGTDANFRSVRWLTSAAQTSGNTSVSTVLAGTTTNAVGLAALIRLREIAPIIPGVVQNFTAVPSSPTNVILNWNAPATGTPPYTYNLKKDGVTFNTTTGLSWSDGGLTTGQTYVYKVSATNATGTSADSPAVSATPMPLVVDFVGFGIPL